MLKLKTYNNQIKLVYKIKVDVFQPFFTQDALWLK